MALRIHFTSQDLGRTRVADSFYSLQEVSIAIRVWRDRSPSVRLEAWRRETAARLSPATRMAFGLTPSHGWVPSFLVPTVGGGSQEELDRLRATPRDRLRADMKAVAARQPVPPWARLLGEDPALLGQLTDSVSAAYDVLLAPYQDQIKKWVEADRAQRARDFLQGGVERVLSQLHPRRVRWEAPVLSVVMASGLDADVHLEGQGLLVVPSAFCVDAPVVAWGEEPQPLLFYPASFEPVSPEIMRPCEASGTLAKLLGRTRAAVLLAIADRAGCSTTELATAARVSLSSASEHASVLRQAGLIATTRRHKTVLHTVTPRGYTLVNST